MQIHLSHEKYVALGLQILWNVKEQHLKNSVISQKYDMLQPKSKLFIANGISGKQTAYVIR